MKREDIHSHVSNDCQMWTQIAGRRLRSAGLQSERQCLSRSSRQNGRLEPTQDTLCAIQMTTPGQNLKKSCFMARTGTHTVDQLPKMCGVRSEAVEKAGLYRCYVCKIRPVRNRGALVNGVKLRRCIICRNVFMCHNHWVSLACLDAFYAVVCCRHTRFTPSGGWNPTGYYPMLEGFPKNIPLQERWQDVDNITVNHRVDLPKVYDPINMEQPPTRTRIPFRIWGDQEASSSDPETGSEYYEELARQVRISANKPYPYPDDTSNREEDFEMTHDLTATSSSRPDGTAEEPSLCGTSADEGQRARAGMPAMSSTGRYHGTGELSSCSTSADEGEYPEAKRAKVAMEIEEVHDPDQIARAQEMDEAYDSGRRTHIEGNSFGRVKTSAALVERPISGSIPWSTARVDSNIQGANIAFAGNIPVREGHSRTETCLERQEDH
eukprot:2307035-Amphidinium_carterae.1